MNFNKKWPAALLVVAVIALPLVVKQVRGTAGTAVEIATVATEAVRPTILASGTLAYGTEVDLTAELVARVSMIAVKEGDTVVAGQLLMQLDPESYRNAIEREVASRRQSAISIERQRVALDLRTRQFARSEELLAAQIIDRNRFDEDRNQFDLAQVDLKSSEQALRRADAVLGEARERLGKTDIRSPMVGTVVLLPIKVGETAIPSTSSLAGAQLIRIADTSAIQAELKVDEADIARIGIGQRAKIYAAAFPDRAMKGVVTRIALAPIVDGMGRAYKVTLSLTAPKAMQLRSGMSVRADIFLGDGARKLAVPVEAIGSETGEDGKTRRFVWRVENDSAKKTYVRTGISDDKLEEITEGLNAGDRIVVGPAGSWRMLADSDLVRQRTTSERNAGSTAPDEGKGEG